MSLSELLTARRSAILDDWFDRVRATYPEQMRTFLARKTDPFSNPVGHALRVGTAALFDGLVRGAGDAELAEALDGIVRVRAIQDFTPAQAVGFVFFLKDVVRARVPAANGPADELRAWEDRIDALALLAFDAYARCREQVHELRTREVRDRSKRVIDRLNARYDWGDDPTHAAAGAQRAAPSGREEGGARSAPTDPGSPKESKRGTT